jgi:hypothetical protein
MLCSPPIAAGVKSDTTKLCNKNSLASFKVNLLVLIMQFIMLSKNIGSWMTPTRSDSLDKFAKLDNSIQCQVVQLHADFA